MAFNQSSNTSSTTTSTNSKFEPGISFLNLALPNGEGNADAKLGPTALVASEPIMQKLHSAFVSGDKAKIAKAEAWIRANIVINWRDSKKVTKVNTTVYDFE